MTWALTPSFSSTHEPPMSDRKGMKWVADEKEILGSPRNSYQRFGRSQAVISARRRSRGWRSAHQVSGQRLDVVELYGGRDVAAFVQAQHLIDALRLRLRLERKAYVDGKDCRLCPADPLATAVNRVAGQLRRSPVLSASSTRAPGFCECGLRRESTRALVPICGAIQPESSP